MIWKNTLSIFNYVHAEDDNDITLWLLLAVMKGLLSLAGESRMSSMLSSADSGLQQQVHFHKQTSSLLVQLSLNKVECYLETAAIKWKIKPRLVSSPHVNLSTL